MSEQTILIIADAIRVAYLRGKRGEDMTATIHELRDVIINQVESENA